MSDDSQPGTLVEESGAEEVSEDISADKAPNSYTDAASHGKVCRIEDIFTLQLLDELRSRFLHSIPLPRLPQQEGAMSGGYMSLSQFAKTISSLLGTDEYAPHLGLLFEKVDTRGSGFLSWSKFCSYLLTYLRERTQAELRAKQLLQGKPRFVRMPSSKQVTVLLQHVDALKKLLLVSKDGVLSLWNRDMTLVTSCKLHSLLPGPIKLKGAPRYKHRAKTWVTSAVYFSQLSKLVLSTTSSDIYFISLISPSSFIAQYQLTEVPSPVFSLACHEQDGLHLLLCGCADGSLLVLRFLRPEQGLFFSELSSKRVECVKVSGRNLHKYHQFVAAASYQVHSHWVRRVQYLPSLQSALSCSHSNLISLAITDLQRIKQPYHFSLPKGVSCFSYCHELGILLTGAVDRFVRVWCPYVPTKPSALLMGHEGFIIDVMVYYPKGVFLSLDTTGMVRIWDAVWNNCIQFIQLNFPIPTNSWEFGQRSLFTGEQTRFVYSACANYVASFILAPGSGDKDMNGTRRSSLKAPPCAALYASLYQLVLVGSEDSSIFSYDLNTGRRQHAVQSAHGGDEITAMCVASPGRRLITSSRLGQSKSWDVNTGELVQTFIPSSPIEVSSLIPVERKEILIAAGWSKEIIVYKDRPEEVDQEYPHIWHDSKQHKEDILCADILFPYVVTGSYDGMLIAWNIETEKELSRACSGIKSRIEIPKRPPSRQGDNIFSSLQRPSSHKLSSRERGRRSPSRLNLKTVIQEEPVPIDALLFLKDTFSKRNKQNSHLVSSEGGCAVFWNIFNFSRPRHTFRLSRSPNDTVLGLATDPLNTLLISGDTKGEIRIFSLTSIRNWRDSSDSALISAVSQPHQNMESTTSWRAHDSAIVSVEFVSRDDIYFILSASVDRNVRLWTAEGNFVGNFGTQIWDIQNPSSYQHPKTPWGLPKQKVVQIISKPNSKEGSNLSLLHSSPALSVVESQETLDVLTQEVSDRSQLSHFPLIRVPNILTQSSKFFSLQPDVTLEPDLLTDSEKLLHVKKDFLIGSNQKETIQERMIRRSERRLRSNAFNLEKTERFPMLCSAYQALDLTEIRSPDIQPISLPVISRQRL